MQRVAYEMRADGEMADEAMKAVGGEPGKTKSTDASKKKVLGLKGEPGRGNNQRERRVWQVSRFRIFSVLFSMPIDFRFAFSSGSSPSSLARSPVGLQL